MSQRSLKKQMEGSDYEDKCGQQADDMGGMSNCKKRKDKSEKRKEQGRNVTWRKSLANSREMIVLSLGMKMHCLER